MNTVKTLKLGTSLTSPIFTAIDDEIFLKGFYPVHWLNISNKGIQCAHVRFGKKWREFVYHTKSITEY